MVIKVRTIFPLGFLALAIIDITCCKEHKATHFPERTFTGPWSMDAKHLERLRINVNAVNLGDDIRHVVDTVGVPDADHTVEKKWKSQDSCFLCDSSGIRLSS
jgi:hypothetical protein